MEGGREEGRGRERGREENSSKKSMHIYDDGDMHSILLLWSAGPKTILLLWSAGPIIFYTAYESH